MLGYYAALQVAMGPLMAFLGPELGLSHAMTGAHLSAFAVGMIAVGSAGERVNRRVGRPASFWGGAIVMGLAMVALLLADQPGRSLTACLIMGLAGTSLLVTIQAALADHHPGWAGIALAEANVVAMLAVTGAPLLIGAAASEVGYRFGVVPILALIVVAPLLARTVVVPAGAAHGVAANAGQSLGTRFWTWWVVILVNVATEWCLVFWTPLLLAAGGGLSTEASASALGLFFGAMFAGRLLGSRLLRRYAPAPLLRTSLAVLAVGFALMWLAPPLALKLLGVAIAGFGVANLYPAGLGLALDAAPEQRDAASSRVVFAVGLALLLAPLLLGGLADRIGIENAFAVLAIGPPVAWAMSRAAEARRADG